MYPRLKRNTVISSRLHSPAIVRKIRYSICFYLIFILLFFYIYFKIIVIVRRECSIPLVGVQAYKTCKGLYETDLYVLKSKVLPRPIIFIQSINIYINIILSCIFLSSLCLISYSWCQFENLKISIFIIANLKSLSNKIS